ncbi:D-alanine--D-alanine ligase [Candidatus Shapirobacteria bacterium]|nr:D-alanine--D-alanine ligase [Candidatus Shapirobacteria bacterium]
MKNKLLNLGIIFGGKSPEHEVSIVTTFQAWPWIDSKKYQRFLIYLDYENQAFLCPTIKKQNPQQFIEKALKRKQGVDFVKKGIKVKKGFFSKKIPLDVILLLTHGGTGENGEFQGLLDFCEIPYTGSNVLGSALSMDKIITKNIFIKLGFKVAPYLWFTKDEFKKNSQKIINQIGRKIKYPVFVKPTTSGSSIGVNKAKNKKELIKAINIASKFDHKILIEKGLEGAVDVNCAVMGGYKPIASVCEQPITEDQFLSFKEKYLKGGKNKGMAGLSRIIPAPISEKTTKEIQQIAKIIFKELNAWGMARIDFLYQKKSGQIYPNEMNTIPGSLAFYLWQASGLKPTQLIDKMIELALERKKDLEKLNYHFKSEILAQR